MWAKGPEAMPWKHIAAVPVDVSCCSVSSASCAVLMAKMRSGPIGIGFCRPNSVSRMPIACSRSVRLDVARHLELALHLFEPLHALLDGRVRGKQCRQRVAAQRRHDEERVHRLRLAEVPLWDAGVLHGIADAQQRGG